MSKICELFSSLTLLLIKRRADRIQIFFQSNKSFPVNFHLWNWHNNFLEAFSFVSFWEILWVWWISSLRHFLGQTCQKLNWTSVCFRIKSHFLCGETGRKQEKFNSIIIISLSWNLRRFCSRLIKSVCKCQQVFRCVPQVKLMFSLVYSLLCVRFPSVTRGQVKDLRHEFTVSVFPRPAAAASSGDDEVRAGDPKQEHLFLMPCSWFFRSAEAWWQFSMSWKEGRILPRHLQVLTSSPPQHAVKLRRENRDINVWFKEPCSSLFSSGELKAILSE